MIAGMKCSIKGHSQVTNVRVPGLHIRLEFKTSDRCQQQSLELAGSEQLIAKRIALKVTVSALVLKVAVRQRLKPHISRRILLDIVQMLEGLLVWQNKAVIRLPSGLGQATWIAGCEVCMSYGPP